MPVKWTMPKWMEQYRTFIGNTGGNAIESLYNDNDTTFSNNASRAALICAVVSQVDLLIRLMESRLLVDIKSRTIVGPTTEVRNGNGNDNKARAKRG